MNKKELDIVWGTLKKYGVHILKDDIRDVHINELRKDGAGVVHKKVYIVSLKTRDEYMFMSQTVDERGNFSYGSTTFKTISFIQTYKAVTILISPQNIKKLSRLVEFEILEECLEDDLSTAIEMLLDQEEVDDE